MIRAIISILMLSLSIATSAQVNKGFSLLKKGKPEEAALAFRADWAHPPESTRALYGMAMVSMDTAYSGYRLDTAFAYVEACSTAYRKLSATQKSQLGKKLNSQLINELKRKITGAAFREVIQINTLEAYQHFLSAYAKAPAHTRRLAVKNRNELVVQSAGMNPVFDDIYRSINPFYESISTETPELKYEADTLIYHAFTRQFGLHSYPNFVTEFPKNVCSSDTVLYVRFQNALTGMSNKVLQQLILQHPASIFTAYALDSLATRLLNKSTPAELKQFVTAHPRHPKNREIWKRFYQHTSESTADPEQLSQFLKSNPDYPFPQQVRQDIDSLKLYRDKVAAQQFRIKPNATDGFAFFEKFPDSGLLPDMRIRFKDFLLSPDSRKADIRKALKDTLFPDYGQELLLELYQRTAALLILSDIEAFERDYPDFMDKSRIAADKKKAVSMPPVKRTPFAAIINTPLDEYSPVLSADGNSLFFCRTPGRNQSGAPFNEDVFLTTRQASGKWSEPVPVTEWNTDRHEAPESISADGNELFLFISGNFNKSTKTNRGWSKPVLLESPLNAFYWQADLKISADGKTLIFAAKDLSDNIDMYVSLLQENGQWGEPFPLGDGINTPGQDRSPFLHPDGTTLYFSSDSQPDNFGRLDIYMTKRLDDSWTRWSDPLNLGPDINTTGDDWGFRVSTDGSFAYFSVNAGGNHDIVRIELPPNMRPREVATITGLVTDMADWPLDAEILWEDLNTGQVIQTTRSHPQQGTFFAILPERKQYAFTVRKEGYFPQSGTIDLRDNLGQITLPKPIRLASLQEMKQQEITLPLNNLFFETAKYDIKMESFPELKRLAALIIKENLMIEIQGHTDDTGHQKANLMLSENRAGAVRDYLLSQGCPQENIHARGYGQEKPRADNRTEEGRAANRRVEIKIRG
jgi:outer membrane protein OmpA-like peptidoglycan-associated protein